MKLYEILIKETIDNFFSNDIEKKQKYASQVFAMLQDAYKKMGGIKGTGFRNEEDMVENIPMWKVFRRGDDIKAVMMYKDKGGRKRVAIATDGTSDGKSMLAKMIKDEALSGRAYGEISDKSLEFTKRILGDAFHDIAVPYDRVIKILKKDYDAGEIRQVNDYEYQRLIGGNWHTKVMVGNPGVRLT